jgi:glycosyltransferase involved in cell wall biosynthesis
MCREASAASYVTREVLQRRYPPGPLTWTTSVSSIDLRDGLAESDKLEARIAGLRRSQGRRGSGDGPWRVGFVGMLVNFYKAPDVLLRAVATCVREGLQMDVAVVGEGKCRPEIEELAARLGLTGNVRFLGALPAGEPVRAFLDDIDLFVLPSRTEGLPRSLIEAMARGCPCIGSTVGGIPELLPPEDMVPPADSDALARKILEVLGDPNRMERMARRNWEAATEYLPEVLVRRRREFYTKVRELSGRGPLRLVIPCSK